MDQTRRYSATPTSTDGRGVPAIREEMNKSIGYSSLLSCCQESLQVSNVTVYASITDQTQEVKTAILTLDFVKGNHQLGPGVERLVLYWHIDGHYVLKWVETTNTQTSRASSTQQPELHHTCMKNIY